MIANTCQNILLYVSWQRELRAPRPGYSSSPSTTGPAARFMRSSTARKACGSARAARVWKYWQRLRGGVMPLRRLQVAELRHHRFPRIGQPHLHLSQGVVSFFGRESPGAPGSPSGASALARRRSAVLERTADRGRAPGACIASRQAPGRVATPSPGRAGPGAAPSRSGGRGVGRWRAGGHR